MQGSMMTIRTESRLLWLVLAVGVLAIFICPVTQAQTVRDLPPPPAPWKPKPTPTPKPPEQEVLDVVKVTSNLVMVPVSVTNSLGQPVQGLQA